VAGSYEQFYIPFGSIKGTECVDPAGKYYLLKNDSA
jgi:hypothetical protein